jgi:hypothetical protein
MNRYTTIAWIVLAGAALGTVGGCTQGGIEVEAAQAALVEETEPAFLDRIADQQTVSENDAFRGLLLLVDGKEYENRFAHRVQTLRDKELVSPRWSYRADRPISRAKLAYMIYQACDMEGGVTLTLLGPNGWYCLKELRQRGMMSDAAAGNPVTGMEYVAVLTRAARVIDDGELPETMQVRNGE